MRSTRTIETMFLPEQSQTMAYTTHKTVNRFACKQLQWCQNEQRRYKPKQWAWKTKARSNWYKKHENVSGQTYSFPKVKLPQSLTKWDKDRYDIRDKKFFLNRTWHHIIEWKQVTCSQNTVEPPVATTSRKRPPLLSNQLSKTPKFSKSNHYIWNLL